MTALMKHILLCFQENTVICPRVKTSWSAPWHSHRCETHKPGWCLWPSHQTHSGETLSWMCGASVPFKEAPQLRFTLSCQGGPHSPLDPLTLLHSCLLMTSIDALHVLYWGHLSGTKLLMDTCFCFTCRVRTAEQMHDFLPWHLVYG